MGAYVSLVLVLTAQPPAKVTVGDSFVVSVQLTNHYNGSNSCGPDNNAFNPDWDYFFSPGLSLISLTETLSNSTSNQTWHLGRENITAEETWFHYSSHFTLLPSAQNSIQLDMEVLVDAKVKQGTLNHNIHVPVDRTDCLDANTSDGLYLLAFNQMVQCSSADERMVEGVGCMAASAAPSVHASSWWGALARLLSA